MCTVVVLKSTLNECKRSPSVGRPRSMADPVPDEPPSNATDGELLCEATSIQRSLVP